MSENLKQWLRALVIAVVLTPLVSLASNLTLPNTFTAGTSIQSAQVNANFTAVQTAVNSKQDAVAGTCVGGAISAISSDGSVTCTGGAVTTAFVQVATASNISSDYTLIDNPATNSNPTAILMVTQSYGDSYIYNTPSVGVFYLSPNWAIFNEDMTPMPVNATFNVLVVTP